MRRKRGRSSPDGAQDGAPDAPGGQDAARARVFVALWPPPGVRDRLDALAQSVAEGVRRSRCVARGNLHLTLAFIGALEEQRVQVVARKLAVCRVEPFEWSLNRVGYFARAHVAWAGGSDNTQLRELADCVRNVLRTLAVGFDERPFVPHVTLLRDVSGPLPRHWPIEPAIAWPCDQPVLVRSETAVGGVRYVPVESHAATPPLPAMASGEDLRDAPP